MLEVRDLEVAYSTDRGRVHAVRGVSFSVEEGAFYTLLGPSGCGKSSTLRSIAGLEMPTGGHITIGHQVVFDSSTGKVVPAYRRNIGMVFQSYAIWPHMSVFDNVAFPIVYGRVHLDKREVRKRVRQALAMVQLEHLADRPAPQLSGGQQQRVALARALVHEPKVLLLDEPLSNLDAKLREEMRQELKELVNRLHITTLYVTHDQTEALAMSDRIAVMHDGLIIQEGTPRDLYIRPANTIVANFLGKMNSIDGTLVRVAPQESMGWVETSFGTFACHAPPKLEPGTRVLMVFRPESAHISEQPLGEGYNTLAGHVRRTQFVGEMVEYQVQAGNYSLLTKGDPFGMFAEGTKVHLNIAPDRCYILETTASGTSSTSPIAPAGGRQPLAE